jgi:hypothetical protein
VRVDDDDLAPDTVAPTVTRAADRGPNSTGRYNAPVTVTWTAVDDGDGPNPAATAASRHEAHANHGPSA